MSEDMERLHHRVVEYLSEGGVPWASHRSGALTAARGEVFDVVHDVHLPGWHERRHEDVPVLLYCNREKDIPTMLDAGVLEGVPPDRYRLTHKGQRWLTAICMSLGIA
jgi:hypothetical protein